MLYMLQRVTIVTYWWLWCQQNYWTIMMYNYDRSFYDNLLFLLELGNQMVFNTYKIVLLAI